MILFILVIIVPIHYGRRRPRSAYSSSRQNELKVKSVEPKVAIPKYTIVKTKDVSFLHCKRYSIRVRVDHVLHNYRLNKKLANFK